MAFISKITPLGSSTTYDISALQLHKVANIGSGATDHGVALKTYFDANYSTIPRNSIIHFYDQTSGNGSATFGYFLNGYDTNPYGGFYVAHYNVPYYVGIQNGTYTQWQLVKADGGTYGISISGTAAKATADGAGNTITSTYVKKSGDTMTGQLYINLDQDVGLNQNGSLVIGNKAGVNVAIDGNEIEARNNGAASTLYLNADGGNVSIGNYTYGYALSTPSFICQSWIRTKGSTGWYNEDYGGGWYMEDSTWIRNYGSKRLYLNAECVVGGNAPYGSFRAVAGNFGAFFRNDGADTYILLTASGDVYGSWNGLRPFRINNTSGYTYFTRGYGAVWNDYAEFRITKQEIEPGRCIKEIGDDTLELTTKRLEKGCEIVSDTYGFAIGESEKAKTPTAASGRVLAYPYEDREIFRQHIGDPVCSGPNGTVSIMTEEEEMRYPSRIIGTVSAIPDYEEWNTGNKENYQPIKVNGRIWIRIR